VALARVLGVAGWQGAGKTTLLERLVPRLVADGLAIVVVEHDVHGLTLDVAGKDSDRLFRAGAEVLVDAPGETLARRRGGEAPLLPRLLALERRYDLVLVEGYKRGPQPKVWLLRAGEEAPPPEVGEVGEVVAVLPWEADRDQRFEALVRRRLADGWAQTPRRAGVLVGGASRRMGRPKEAIEIAGRPLLARVAEALAPAGAVTLLGGGGAAALPRLPDVPDAHGPLAGILAALRWEPACWVVASCDLPRLRADAVEWLLAQRRPGRWAVLPRVGGVVQPLLAVYEAQALPLLEALAAEGAAAPSRLEGQAHVATPEPPAELAACWRGVNTPQELAALGGLAEPE
jgi:molybdopterin-guanine dinucleotide biosynthesis protein B